MVEETSSESDEHTLDHRRLELVVDTWKDHMDRHVIDHDLDGSIAWMVLPRLHGWRAPKVERHLSMGHQKTLGDLQHIVDEEPSNIREIALLSVDRGLWQTVASHERRDDVLYDGPSSRDDYYPVDREQLKEHVEREIEDAFQGED